MCKQKDTHKNRNTNPCPECKGKTYITVYRHDSAYPLRIKCPVCSGTGTKNCV